jgi:hypothetical protein
MIFKDEWKDHAKCLGDSRFTSSVADDDAELFGICASCPVRLACMRWVLEEEVVDVFAVGVRWPEVWEDPFIRVGE